MGIDSVSSGSRPALSFRNASVAIYCNNAETSTETMISGLGDDNGKGLGGGVEISMQTDEE